MAKRKRKHFGGDAGSHHSAGAKDARRAAKLARKVKAMIAQDQCRSAMGLLSTALRYAGQTEAEAFSSGRGQAKIEGRFKRSLLIAKRAIQSVGAAEDRFRLACVRNTGEIDKMRRGR